MYEYIEFIICYGQGIKPEEMKEETRKEEVVYVRQLIMYFCRKYNIGSLRAIGEMTAGKDHATVSHSVKTINNYIDTDKVKKVQIEYYDMLLGKVLTLAKQKDDLKELMKPLEKEISELEQRCINLTLQLAFLRKKTTLGEVMANG